MSKEKIKENILNQARKIVLMKLMELIVEEERKNVRNGDFALVPVLAGMKE